MSEFLVDGAAAAFERQERRDNGFLLGRHAALLETLAVGQEEMRQDVRTILNTLAEKKGERRIMLWTASALGGISGLAASLVHGITGGK